MKKTIQIISLLGLAFFFGGIDANAQALGSTFDADIPFDFAIGKTAFAAGTYKLRVSGQQNGVKLLEVRNQKRELLYMGLISENGDRLYDSSHLKFVNVSGVLSLARLVTQKTGFSVPRSTTPVLIAKEKKAKDSTATN